MINKTEIRNLHDEETSSNHSTTLTLCLHIWIRDGMGSILVSKDFVGTTQTVTKHVTSVCISSIPYSAWGMWEGC